MGIAGGASATADRLIVQEAADWRLLGERDAVVDPMVLRYGEVFLGGQSAAGERAGAKWRAMANDIGGLCLFFDQIMLRERIPVFNYGDTFDLGLNFTQRVLGRVNAREPVLVEVDVRFDPYRAAKEAALEQVAELLEEEGALPGELVPSVIRELSALEYEWNPDITALGLRDDRQRQLAAFLVGGLIFSAYAQQIGAPHVLQPKRARLFTAVSLRADNASYEFEGDIFAALAEVARRSGGGAIEVPTLSFLPLLLERGSAGETALDLLERALAFRALPGMREYRALLASLFAEWAAEGRVSKKTRQAIGRLAARVARELGVHDTKLMTARLNAVALATGRPPLDVGVDLEEGARRLWGWALPGLINRGTRKLLSRAAIAQPDYVRIEKALKSRWNRT